jgi:NitT/TauT family transport system substrate-binding protein
LPTGNGGGEDYDVRRYGQMKKPSLLLCIAFVCLSLIGLPAFAQSGKPEKAKLVLAVGGKQGMIYLPLTVIERLGYFKEAGLDVDIEALAGGGQALKALVGGSADVVSGFYDHTIQLAAQGKKLKAIVMQQRYPGLVLLVSKYASDRGVKTLADLKGKKIGVTAPGSSSHFFVNHLLTGAGLSTDDFATIGVGLGSTAIAAVRNRQIEALSALEPAVTTLQTSGDVGAILADTRTTADTQKVFGGPYPAACIYVREEFIGQYPNTAQAVVNAMIKGLRWMQAHKLEEIVALMPEEYYQGNKTLYTQALKSMMDSYSPDGRIAAQDSRNVMKVLSFDPAVKKATINLAETYDMRFVDAYWKTQKK